MWSSSTNSQVSPGKDYWSQEHSTGLSGWQLVYTSVNLVIIFVVSRQALRGCLKGYKFYSFEKKKTIKEGIKFHSRLTDGVYTAQPTYKPSIWAAPTQDLEKQQGISSKPLEALWIISHPIWCKKCQNMAGLLGHPSLKHSRGVALLIPTL